MKYLAMLSGAHPTTTASQVQMPILTGMAELPLPSLVAIIVGT